MKESEEHEGLRSVRRSYYTGRGSEVPELPSEGRMVFGEYDEADFREEGVCDSRAHLSCNPLATVIGKLRVCPEIFRE